MKSLKKLMIFGLILSYQMIISNDEVNEKLTITKILAPSKTFSDEYTKRKLYNTSEQVLYYGCNDEFTELSKAVVVNLRKFPDQTESLNKLCSADESDDLKYEMRKSLMDIGGDNDRSSCVLDIFWNTSKPSDPHHNMTIHELLVRYDACQKQFSKSKSTYSNYKYNENMSELSKASDVRDLQAKKDFNTSREKYDGYRN